MQTFSSLVYYLIWNDSGGGNVCPEGRIFHLKKIKYKCPNCPVKTDCGSSRNSGLLVTVLCPGKYAIICSTNSAAYKTARHTSVTIKCVCFNS